MKTAWLCYPNLDEEDDDGPLPPDFKFTEPFNDWMYSKVVQIVYDEIEPSQ